MKTKFGGDRQQLSAYMDQLEDRLHGKRGSSSQTWTFGLDVCGWVISREDSSKKRTHVTRTFLSRQPNEVVRNSCCDIDQNLKRSWEVESCGMETNDVKIRTECEKRALGLVSESLLYQNRRYQVYPFHGKTISRNFRITVLWQPLVFIV